MSIGDTSAWRQGRRRYRRGRRLEREREEGKDEEGGRGLGRGRKSSVQVMKKGVIEDEEEEEGVERRGMEEERSLYSSLTSLNDSALALAPLPRSFWLTCGQEGDQWDGECAVEFPSQISQSNLFTSLL